MILSTTLQTAQHSFIPFAYSAPYDLVFTSTIPTSLDCITSQNFEAKQNVPHQTISSKSPILQLELSSLAHLLCVVRKDKLYLYQIKYPEPDSRDPQQKLPSRLTQLTSIQYPILRIQDQSIKQLPKLLKIVPCSDPTAIPKALLLTESRRIWEVDLKNSETKLLIQDSSCRIQTLCFGRADRETQQVFLTAGEYIMLFKYDLKSFRPGKPKKLLQAQKGHRSVEFRQIIFNDSNLFILCHYKGYNQTVLKVQGFAYRGERLKSVFKQVVGTCTTPSDLKVLSSGMFVYSDMVYVFNSISPEISVYTENIYDSKSFKKEKGWGSIKQEEGPVSLCFVKPRQAELVIIYCSNEIVVLKHITPKKDDFLPIINDDLRALFKNGSPCSSSNNSRANSQSKTAKKQSHYINKSGKTRFCTSDQQQDQRSDICDSLSFGNDSSEGASVNNQTFQIAPSMAERSQLPRKQADPLPTVMSLYQEPEGPSYESILKTKINLQNLNSMLTLGKSLKVAVSKKSQELQDLTTALKNVIEMMKTKTPEEIEQLTISQMKEKKRQLKLARTKQKKLEESSDQEGESQAESNIAKVQMKPMPEYRLNYLQNSYTKILPVDSSDVILYQAFD